MKKWFAIVLVVFATKYSGFAQNPCATSLTDAWKQELNQYHSVENNFNFLTNRTVYNLPIQFHIVGQDNGNGYYSITELFDLLCQLNERYAPVGFHFYLNDVPQYINNSLFYVHDFTNGDAMMAQNNYPDVINVYIVASPAGYCGYYTYGMDAITVAISCNHSGSTTLAHELGHYFSLPHPFDNVNGIDEFVNGSNCTVGGDLFCDTRADFLNYRWQCPFTGVQLDFNGDQYDPDSSLYMSYSLDGCQNRFSDEETSAMIYDVSQIRTNLWMNSNVVNNDSTTAITLLEPLDQATNVTNSAVTFRWTKSNGATQYHIIVSKYGSFAYPNVNAFTTDTSFTCFLPPSTQWHWKVRPFNNGNTCTPYSLQSNFETSVSTTIVETDLSDLNVTDHLIEQGQPFLIHFNNASLHQYKVCLYDLNGSMVLQQPINSGLGNEFDLINCQQLGNGLYIGKIANETGVQQTFKLVIQ